MPRFAVTITYTSDVERLHQVRPVHREYLRTLLDTGKLVESGPFADDSGALMIYEVDDLASAQEQLANDPYAQNGIIATASIQEWNVVMSR
jgi:uncharacterized protein YciI